MSDAKAFKREIRAVWNTVKRERRARAKHMTSSGLAEAAFSLASLAAKLNELAAQAKKTEKAAPVKPGEDAPTPNAKSKAKRKAKPKWKTKVEKA